jgi:KipI family sensor histidine kinase inhibitor
VVDAVVTEQYVAAYFSGEPVCGDLGLLAQPDESEPGAEHVIGVVYDGPDLAFVAERAGLTEREVIELHVSASYEVAMMGFAPGFAYLTGLDRRLVMPRREAPRPRVAAGSVAIGGPYTGVYPCASPGGWHLLGRTSMTLFDPEIGALLALGDRVRFVHTPPAGHAREG